MLSASSPWVSDNFETSDFNVPNNCSNSRLRSSLIESALRIRSSIFPTVSSIIRCRFKIANERISARITLLGSLRFDGSDWSDRSDRSDPLQHPLDLFPNGVADLFHCGAAVD